MEPPADRLPFGDALRAWLLIAVQSFGGPAAQIAVMHRVVVDERKWLSEERFLHALNYCMLLPGPEAQQLVSYLGWIAHGVRGGLISGALFVLPGFLSILLLSSLYAAYHEVPVVSAALFGLKASVLAVVVEAMVRIGRRVLKEPATFAVAALAFVALFFFEVPFPAVIVGAGLFGALAPRAFPPPGNRASAGEDTGAPILDRVLDDPQTRHVQPRPARDGTLALAILGTWLAPTLLLWVMFGPDVTFTRIATFFSGAAVVTFGGAYSVLAYVGQHAVEAEHWLSAGEMLDGLGLAETTPGPLIQVVQFVGYLAAYRDPGALPPLLAGFLGSVLTTFVTFAPSFLFVLVGAPYVEAVRKVTALASALRAITSAVVGVVANLAVWLTLHVWFGEVTESHHTTLGTSVRLLAPDLATFRPFAVAIAMASAVALLRYHVEMWWVLGVGAAIGVAWWAVGA